jgi:D-arabinose 5-phosphate isomerase GutQ
MKIFVDLDETLCYHKNEKRIYSEAEPIDKNINIINNLYLENIITIWTARGTETKINHEELTKQQLESWGVKYHYLLFGKPSYDLYIDDKSINSVYNFSEDTINNFLYKKHYKYLENTNLNNKIIKQKNQIDNFFNNLNTEIIDKLCNKILNYDNIYFLGIGKSGIMANYISDALKSINIKSFYLNAINLSHGDIGCVSENSLAIIITKSSNTEELKLPILLLKNKKCNVILLSMQKGDLTDICDDVLYLPNTNELDEFNCIPTTSFTLYSIFANIMISHIIEKKNISLNDYKYNHISGNIGKNLFGENKI